MSEVKVVIGKNFGDEGKGMTVDSLCRGKHAVVVRHNGGAQAGHTVEAGQFRFVFHQLGSGSRLGCPTYWSETFLPDLLKLGEEAEALRSEMRKKLGKTLQVVVYAHEESACTTVYDVLLNSLTEQLRGSKKHGSCGMGIYETVLRTKEEKYALRLKEFAGAKVNQIAEKLRLIRDEYVKARLQELCTAYSEECLQPESREWIRLIGDENLLWNAAEMMCENFRRYVILADWEEILHRYPTIVFENGQGLMLDEDNLEYYPHLTPSHTGLFNVLRLIEKQEEVTSLEILYVTRTYVTRHGAGRLDYECPKEEINPDMVDKTNVPNLWQGDLRYAKHPPGELFWKYMDRDLEQLKEWEKPLTVSLCLTHLDETGEKILFADQDQNLSEFIRFCEEQRGITVKYINKID